MRFNNILNQPDYSHLRTWNDVLVWMPSALLMSGKGKIMDQLFSFYAGEADMLSGFGYPGYVEIKDLYQ